MRIGRHIGRNASTRAFLLLLTLLAWMTTVSLFIILKLAPLTRGAPAMKYYAALTCLLPWLAGCVFWTRVRSRERLDTADRDMTGFCYRVIFFTVGAAYGAVVSIESVLLWVLTRAK